jgi:hypothetical protein
MNQLHIDLEYAYPLAIAWSPLTVLKEVTILNTRAIAKKVLGMT